MAWICVDALLDFHPELFYPKIVEKISLKISTMKRMFRLTHQESGGEKKKTFGYETKTEEKLLRVSLLLDEK